MAQAQFFGMSLTNVYSGTGTILASVYLPKQLQIHGLRCYLALNHPLWASCKIDGSTVYRFKQESAHCPALQAGHAGLPECAHCAYWQS
jgi:hypothetical protein